jgi:isopentenyl-diphosphate delta-isomerase
MSSAEGPGTELVVLLDEEGRSVGTAPKADVHHESTPLHLAFSCYVADADGRLLLTQRARSKRTFPGVWTNTVCGHPGPGEDLSDAVRRRARQELGITLSDVRLLLPAFRYRAVAEDGTVENEICPVFTARTADEPRPDPAEVEAHEWVDFTELRRSVARGERPVSQWCVEELEQMPEDPFAADAEPDAALPAAALRQPPVRR